MTESNHLLFSKRVLMIWVMFMILNLLTTLSRLHGSALFFSFTPLLMFVAMDQHLDFQKA